MFFPNQDILKLVAKISFDSKFQKIFCQDSVYSNVERLRDL